MPVSRARPDNLYDPKANNDHKRKKARYVAVHVLVSPVFNVMLVVSARAKAHLTRLFRLGQKNTTTKDGPKKLGSSKHFMATLISYRAAEITTNFNNLPGDENRDDVRQFSSVLRMVDDTYHPLILSLIVSVILDGAALCEYRFGRRASTPPLLCLRMVEKPAEVFCAVRKMVARMVLDTPACRMKTI